MMSELEPRAMADAAASQNDTRMMPSTKSRYHLGRRLGIGATATVWLAKDRLTGQDVAVKQFHPHLLSDEESRRRIAGEAQVAGAVSHPNLVSAIDTVDSGSAFSLIFPYVEGDTLARRLASDNPVSSREAAEICLQITDAAAAAHASGIVHRDIKPANILLGEDGRARLLDFGIARELGVDGHTGAGLAVGTLAYMSPEQLAAQSPTPATDVYSIGVVLYELLAGRRPYEAASPVGLALEQQLPPRPIDGAPQALMDASLSAMSADAAARPSASQLGRSFRGWLDGRLGPGAETVTVDAVVASTLPVESRRAPLPLVFAMGVAAVALVAVLTLALASGLRAPSNPVAVVPASDPTVAVDESASPALAEIADEPTPAADRIVTRPPSSSDSNVDPPERAGGDQHANQKPKQDKPKDAKPKPDTPKRDKSKHDKPPKPHGPRR